MQLKLNGLGANTVTVLTNGQELTPENGHVTLLVPEGQQQLLFVLRAPDVSANTVLSLNAVLVNSARHGDPRRAAGIHGLARRQHDQIRQWASRDDGL